ncbi:hypothetical protein JVT61DRAFT_4294 [Boletus reticuloceps]|uniref:Uncharacterized protein n=1 Tax=Boletus reticuloceps TaxID=495285 RepID=A0A8I3A761_9AGAM|nr:hypothetical protein JVT61DRAFT_4294 [Boletus reticuloceps]
MPSTMHLNSDGLKALEMDVTEFVVKEGAKMSKAAKEYIKTMWEAIKRTLSHMPPGGSITFSLPEPANQSQSLSGNSRSRDEGSQSRKHGRDTIGPEPVAKRSKPSNIHLIDLLQGQSEVADTVLLLQDSLTIVNAGANSQILHWHLKRVTDMVPNNAEIEEAVDMLSECISYKEKL